MDLSAICLTEVGGLVFGLCYIFCAHKQTNYSWFFGIASALCIIFVDYYHTKLYFDIILHGFFLIMSCIGLFLWINGAKPKTKIRISQMPLSNFLLYLLVSILISGAAGFLLDTQTEAAFPYLDCFQMMLSIFATFLIIYCILNAWVYWILVDIVSISLYILTGAYLLAILYFGYLISNAIQWQSWRKQYVPHAALKYVK